jgi:murein L,D-transpeptidase YafK
MKIPLLFSLFVYMGVSAADIDSFEIKQKRFERVSGAYLHCEKKVQASCKKLGVKEYAPIFLRVFKKEKILQVWIEKKDSFIKYNEFKICASSGTLGPKRKQGDNQVPEGFYHIAVFNPLSLYHLSLGINYPNASDNILSKAPDKGGDIYIHGECASIGCMAMDTSIEEIYVLAVKARSGGQEEIPVHIFPFKMTDKNYEREVKLKTNQKYVSMWNNIRQGFLYFNRNKKLPKVEVDKKGNYIFR